MGQQKTRLVPFCITALSPDFSEPRFWFGFCNHCFRQPRAGHHCTTWLGEFRGWWLPDIYYAWAFLLGIDRQGRAVFDKALDGVRLYCSRHRFRQHFFPTRDPQLHLQIWLTLRALSTSADCGEYPIRFVFAVSLKFSPRGHVVQGDT